jgi:beta-phosphoglucomutase
MGTQWRPGAVIFDLDGVLVDSEPLHQRALDAVLADLRRRALRPDEHATFVGLDDRRIWGLLVQRLGLSGTPDTHIQHFERVLAALIAGNVEPAPGAAELVASLADAGVPIALASSSRRVWY